jgi:hypothetical protein|tara:strand:- start:3789 stop:4391 length:603 start_codon:yes stop_codon:yes gene_type:complete
MATVTNTLSRQPTKLDYAAPTQFKFNIFNLPKVEYFIITANVPGISLTAIDHATPFKTTPILGDGLTYDNLDISFIVDENYENYLELHNWLVGIGFPQKREQFKDYRDTESGRFPGAKTRHTSKDIGDTKLGAATPDKSLYSDATMTLLSSKHNPVVEVRFRDVFPLTMAALEYTQADTDVTYLTMTASFAYSHYEVITL